MERFEGLDAVGRWSGYRAQRPVRMFHVKHAPGAALEGPSRYPPRYPQLGKVHEFSTRVLDRPPGTGEDDQALMKGVPRGIRARGRE